MLHNVPTVQDRSPSVAILSAISDNQTIQNHKLRHHQANGGTPLCYVTVLNFPKTQCQP